MQNIFQRNVLILELKRGSLISEVTSLTPQIYGIMHNNSVIKQSKYLKGFREGIMMSVVPTL